MASLPKRMELGATPGRLCLVVVLAIILFVVLYVELSRTESTKAATAVVPPPRQAVARPGPSTATNTTHREDSRFYPADAPRLQSANDLDMWNAIALDTVFEHDPFAVPAAFLPPPVRHTATTMNVPSAATSKMDDSSELDRQRKEREKLAAEAKARDDALKALENQGVSLVLGDGRQWIALVGDKTIRVGDQLDAFRVIEILPHGVVIEGPSAQR